jgi:hypothetical protein
VLWPLIAKTLDCLNLHCVSMCVRLTLSLTLICNNHCHSVWVTALVPVPVPVPVGDSQVSHLQWLPLSGGWRRVFNIGDIKDVCIRDPIIWLVTPLCLCF